jgi:hypothetical protein
MIWLVISAYAVLGLLFVLGMCRAASRAGSADLHLRHRTPERTVDLTEAADDDEQAERGA